MDAIGHLIGGKRVAGASGRGAPVFNPATGEQTGTVALASASEVDEAVRVAAAAQAGWAATPPLMRA
ncbi:MAG: aldehyde dehydrogenase family protein, partial [Alphaproteobacteria bacterium]